MAERIKWDNLERFLEEEGHGDIDPRIIEPKGAQLTPNQIETGIRIAKIFLEWAYEKGYIRIPSWSDVFKEKQYWYLINDELRSKIKKYLSGKISIGKKYGLVFGSFTKRDMEIVVNAFISFGELKKVESMRDDCNQLIKALGKVEKGNISKDLLETVNRSTREILAKLEKTGWAEFDYVNLKKTSIEGFNKRVKSIIERRSNKELRKYLTSKFRGVYCKSTHVQKRKTPLPWLRHMALLEKGLQTKISGAFPIEKPKKYVFIRKDYNSLLYNIFKSISDPMGERKVEGFGKRSPWIVICFAGYTKASEFEDIKKSMEKPEKVKEISSVCITCKGKTLCRLFCKKAGSEEISI